MEIGHERGCPQQQQAGQNLENDLARKERFARFEEGQQQTADADQRAAHADQGKAVGGVF